MVAQDPSAYPWQAWSVIVAESEGAAILAVPFSTHCRTDITRDGDRGTGLRRGFPQLITRGFAGMLGPPANEQGHAHGWNGLRLALAARHDRMLSG